MSFKMCPQCFAEVYQQTVCSFCGYRLDDEDNIDVLSSPPSLSLSKFELTGLPYQVDNYIEIPKGTLFVSRYSILQYKQSIEEGACYIAYDHWLGRHTFLTLFIFRARSGNGSCTHGRQLLKRVELIFSLFSRRCLFFIGPVITVNSWFIICLFLFLFNGALSPGH